MRDDELIAAYLDGVAELTPEERKRAEAAIAAAPGDVVSTRAMIERLRALDEAPAQEPDWTAMERSISAAVGPDVPRPWWRLWRWAVPVVVCAAAAVIAVISLTGHDAPAPIAHHATVPPPKPSEPSAQLVYLDGEVVDLDMLDTDPAALDDAIDDAPDIADEETLLPNLEWVDHLDDRALDHAERVLARSKT